MLRHVARALLGAVFIHAGIDQIRRPQSRALAAGPYVSSLAQRTRVPDDPILLVRVNGGLMVAGGLGLVTDTAARPSAVVLAASLIPTTVFGYQFWRAGDPDTRSRQREQFLTSAGLLGGLIFAALDTAGRPGLTWRAREGTKRASRATRRAGRTARRDAAMLRREAKITRRAVTANVRADRLEATRAAERTVRRSAKRARRAVASVADSLPGSAT